ncbi:MAG: DUF924 domain-containing protein [Pelagimonas sp.]|jgi:uncharacterized protein (DUF924 family)|nr:DUF924 domain-containing protein [Pelagimonas sp.]
MSSPEEILKFWLDDVGPAGWYKQDPALDDEIRQRFEADWERLRDGGCGLWMTYPSGMLAALILADQFPRNMFRGEGKAFATDGKARALAKQAIARNWDLRIDEPARQFFYLPLMHSEILSDQERCVRLMLERMPEGGASNLLHARAHRAVIREFGRFPYRNPALSRRATAAEQDYVEKGGYGYTLQAFQVAA